MTESIIDLPAELQEHIFGYCSISDLTSLSSVSKRYYHCVQHLLWREIEIPWKTIQKESVLPTKLERLKLTREINFSDKDDGNGFVPRPSKWVHVASNYKKILKNCNRNKLTSLKVHGLVADNGIKIVCNLLNHLRELWLCGCNYTTIVAWQTLSTCQPLRKLTIEDCRIFNVGIKTICESKTIVEFCIQRCQLITDPSMELIGKMSQLKKLSVSHNRNITTKGLRCLARLRNLNCLRLEYSDVDSDGNSCLCQLTISLERVDSKGAHRLNVTGFYEFPPPPTFEGTNIQEDKLPRVALEHFRKMKEMEEDMKSEDLVLTIDKHASAKDGKCRMNWKCTSLL